ncbi:MAG: N-methyl-D-aspartate receptor NMDAR2C subunit [Pseudomonadota bacterium]
MTDGTAPELRASWQRCWAGLGAKGDGAGVLEDLLARHAQPWRRYHTLQHLRECIAWFERASALALHPAEVEAALWFHDAVYDLPGSGNEERSAALAVASLAPAGVAAEAVARVERMVLATQHGTDVPGSADAQLLVDIDLAILGAPPPRFAEYEAQIRAEYAFVPEVQFLHKRSEILQSFLAQPRIYGTAFFFDALERQARENLARGHRIRFVP